MAAARLLAIGLILTGGIAASRPGVMPGTLTLSVGGESTEFEITYCRTEAYKALGTTIEAEATAVGSFRGQPAAPDHEPLAALLQARREAGNAVEQEARARSGTAAARQQATR